MADIDGAIGYVVAHGDPVDRARLSYLRSGIAPPAEVLAKVEMGQAARGGWPAFWAGDVASIDATCFRLAELDDLGALDREPARKALVWLAARQRPDGTWEEDESLADAAPVWARPGDPEARLYLTANASFWLAVTQPEEGEPNPHAEVVARATQAFRAAMREDGTWPSYLAAGWLGAALRRAGMSGDDWLLTAARKRLTETQRSDGGWPSDDGPAFDVHTTLTAIRALR